MAAAMNGMALHGGCVPYGGTFLVFSDYARGAMRLSSLMGMRVVYVMTHDSIGLGEDGPTHQPVEHLAMLRATPNVQRVPARRHDRDRRSLGDGAGSRRPPRRFSRSAARTCRWCARTHSRNNMTARGAYVLAEAEGKRQAILLATGSEVEIAMAAREALHAKGIGTRVVSMPCWELFEEQDEA